MQEEVEQRVVTLIVNCTKLTEQELRKALGKLLTHLKTQHQTKQPHGKMTVKAGVTVLNNGKYSSLFENGYYNWKQQDGIANPSLTIDGGTFRGGLNTIKNDDNATLTINDGLFANYAQAAFQNHHAATVNGGTFVGSKGAKAVINCGRDGCTVNEHDLHSLTILDGRFTGAFVNNSDASVVIYAGLFSEKPADSLLAPGKAAVEDHDESGYAYKVAAADDNKIAVEVTDSVFTRHIFAV